MKKIISLVLTFVILLSACGTGDSGEITVGISGTPTEIQMIEDQAQRFTEKTGIEVTLKQYTDFNTEIQTELIGGTAPDVFFVEAYVLPFFQEQGVLASLDKDSIDIENYEQNLLSSFTIDDEVYSLPKDYSTLAIYTNNEYVNSEDLPTDYNELEEYLTELKKNLPDDVCPMSYNVDLARQMYLAQSGGGSIIDEKTGLATLTDQEMIDNLDLEFNLARKGLMCTPVDYGFGWNGEMFGNGKTAIMLEGNWVAGELENNYSTVDFETHENFTVNGEKGTMAYNVGWGINSSSKNTDSAYEFVNFMNSDEIQTERFEIAGTLPSTMSATESLDLNTHEIFAPHVAGAGYATTWQKGNTLQTLNTEYLNYMPAAASNDSTTKSAIEKTQSEANKIIEANG